MNTLISHILKSSLVTAGLAVTASIFAVPAQAFTLGYNGYFGSTNDPATGASATIDFSFTDQADGSISMELLLTNTTEKSEMGEALTTAGATDSKFLSAGLDWSGGDLYSYLDVQEVTLGSPAFDELVRNDSSLKGGTSSSTAINGDGWGDVSLNSKTFDIGLITNKNLSAGGSPKDGLDAGASETVTFNLAATNFDNASALEQWFKDGFVEDGYLSTAARFKDVNAGAGSDKLMGGNVQEYFDYTRSLNEEPVSAPEPVEIPEPGTVLALGSVMFGAAGVRRRIK
ncbi:PEP-CTERM sorting domain-containing protein [Spirulina sp. CS-785/01]|uniref:PEP-CTERM sorting domain-containing protein n=1 Tax=Spirulina sp. CS-785/01 TaxID=3021716 RepID=UPI00232DEB3E|nr:PEP-CTERM sorting domain-containing protein [Spirulina sp. CS-785/01]MDB9313652.1 PEP-CTERM sorting domain-containing protein [Spirulina sp. CS-785/01]